MNPRGDFTPDGPWWERGGRGGGNAPMSEPKTIRVKDGRMRPAARPRPV